MFSLLGVGAHLAARARVREGEAREKSHELAREVERHAGTAQTLRQSSTLLEGLFESAPDAVVVVDPAGRIVRANGRAIDLFGWSRTELLSMQVEGLVPPRFREDHPMRRLELLEEAAHPSLGVLRDLSAVRRDGVEFPIDLSLARLSPGVDSLVIAVVRDVTDRRRSEAALRDSIATLESKRGELAAQGEVLRASEARFRSVVESTSDGIVVDDLAGRVVFANGRFFEIFGVPPADLPGVRIEDCVTPASRAGVRARHVRRVSGQDEPSQFEFEGLHRDGTSRWIDVRVVVLRDRDGRIVGTQSALRDVTERRNADLALKSSEAQLRQAQKMEAVGRLAGGVAHDFNNLLCVILGYGRLVADALGPDSPQAAFVEQIVRAGQGAEALTRQLLTFSRRQVLEPRVLDLNGVVRGVEKMLRRVIGEDISLVTELTPDPAVALVDAGHMEQVLMNLVVNARDAMPDGGRLTIRTAFVQGGGSWGTLPCEIPAGPRVVLSVVDTGTGMSAETQARLFEPFFTTKPQGRGTGLGLATVHGIVLQSGGQVCVSSSPGEGTEFRVYLPRLEGDVEGDGHADVDVKAYDGHETVLLAEDQAPVREIVRLWLERRGYRVLEAADGLQGIEVEAAHAGQVDLLVTDVIMPRASGKELARVLREKWPNLPVLYISGYTDDMVQQHGALEPGTRLLDKPLSEASFLRAVRESLDGAPRPA